MLDATPPSAHGPARDKLLRLLDYVEQVVRLEERVAYDLDDYKLADGRPARFSPADTAGLPGVTHDADDEHGAVWLAVERLSRDEPPVPPDDLAAWIVVARDPGQAPVIHQVRTVVVDEATRLARIAAGACASRFLPVGREPPGDGSDAPATSSLQTLVLAEQPSTGVALDRWTKETWAAWAAVEAPRRRTIQLYERLYGLLQQREGGGAEASIEIVWGIGVVRWGRAGRPIARPLLERLVDLELDGASGTIRVLPTAADAVVDLKPFEEAGVPGLAALDEMLRNDIDAASAGEGVSPFRRASFEPLLAGAAARLQPDGVYRPGGETESLPADTLTIDDSWVLFARPRSTHVLIADIDRLRTAARDDDLVVEGLALRLVTPPSAMPATAWAELSDTLGESAALHASPARDGVAGDVFFPKPFNDDQIAIVRRLARSDGLVVQGPPGTGKTHTIANLICHAMATGQRVLVVSRGEAALAVLRDHLPEKVRPLAIALLSNERQGLGQVEAAIREVQAVVEGSRPDIRHAAIRRCEADIVRVRSRIAAIDTDLDALAASESTPLGPRAEAPADLARRIAGERGLHAWFTDRPALYMAQTDLTEADLRALATGRRRVGVLLDHCDTHLPAACDVPTAETVAGWHAVLAAAEGLSRQVSAGPAAGLVLDQGQLAAAEALANALDGIAALQTQVAAQPWLRRILSGVGNGHDDPWSSFLARLTADWRAAAGDRAALAAEAVDLPPDLIDDRDAREAVERGARGERLWPLLGVGRAKPKALLAAVRVRGRAVREHDAAAWGAVRRRLLAREGARDIEARWHSFASEAGAPDDLPASELSWIDVLLAHHRAGTRALATLPMLRSALSVEAVPERAELNCTFSSQLRAAIKVAQLAETRTAVARLRGLFADGADRTSVLVRRITDDALGRFDVEEARILATWRDLRHHLERLQEHREERAAIVAMTERIAAAGAPGWAERLRRETASPDRDDPLIPANWRDAWDAAAAAGDLARRDPRGRLAALARERESLDRQGQRLFVELVRERTFYTLERRLSPAVKSALVEFVRALGRLGKGTGRTAGRQRRAARDAMRRCYEAVPCWIMPTWRVAEQLPSELGTFDLVILDEASQSDITELPAVLRGKKILVVGDDRQVSPGSPFVSQARIDALRRRYLAGLPYQGLLEPGESLYTLMQAVFPDERLMLREHFRCVEPIIRFSMGFYPEALVPLRVPAAAERLEPPLVDIYVPHGRREKNRKINRAEAAVIVDEVAALAATSGMERRSIGVISLIGGEQAGLIGAMLDERLGAELVQRHRVLCGDSAAFQGNERDIVFLSMVADRDRHTALTMLRYAQRFNVAMSRGRDRVVLVRSVVRADLSPADLKARLILHFEDPMPALKPHGDLMERCESDFERDMLRGLLARNYRAEPQVGALGYRIDLVIEGRGGRRLAVECDGDAFHGPDRWRDDMRRQRILERVGWQFWRCFASSFYADPEGTLADLVQTLARAGIEPTTEGQHGALASRWVEHRVAPAPAGTTAPDAAQGELVLPSAAVAGDPLRRTAASGDRVMLVFPDGRKPLAVTLTDDGEDWDRGRVGITSPVGRVLVGREEDEEIDLPLASGLQRAVIEKIEFAPAG